MAKVDSMLGIRPMKRIWVLSHRRQGDLKQMVQLADAIGWDYEVKKITVPFTAQRRMRVFSAFFPSLLDLNGLKPPWPDLVLCAEARTQPIGLEAKARSGGAVKVVCINRPRGRLGDYDLVITAPHYRLPQLANVLELPMALHDLDKEKITLEASKLAPRLIGLSRPFTVALIGASSGTEKLDAEDAKMLAWQLNERVRRSGGSLILTTSPRTSSAVADVLSAHLTVPRRCFLWTPGAPNPYEAMLGSADEFVVTSDSASMVTEAVLTGKPVYIYYLSRKSSLCETLLEALHERRGRMKLIDSLFDSGLLEARADRRLLHDQLREVGNLAEFSPDSSVTSSKLPRNPVAQAAGAVRALFKS